MEPTAVLVVASAAFLATHFVTSTPLRPALVRAIGEWPYRGLYSLVALGGIVWMAGAYGNAPYQPLWAGLRLVPVALMPIAFVLLVCGYSRNPTAIGGEGLLKTGEPAHGMIRVTRHPLMWAIALWSGAHLAASGDLASVIFFGGFLLLAGAGTLTMDARRKADPDWARFAALT